MERAVQGQEPEALNKHAPFAYYFGSDGKCNFFVASSILGHFFNSICHGTVPDGIGKRAGQGCFRRYSRAAAAFVARSCRASKTTRSISSQGAGLPVQISN